MLCSNYLNNDFFFKNIGFSKNNFKFLLIYKIFCSSFKEVSISFIFNLYLMFFITTGSFCFVKSIIFKTNLKIVSRKKRNKNLFIYFSNFLNFIPLTIINLSYFFPLIIRELNNKELFSEKGLPSQILLLPLCNSILINLFDLKFLSLFSDLIVEYGEDKHLYENILRFHNNFRLYLIPNNI